MCVRYIRAFSYESETVYMRINILDRVLFGQACTQQLAPYAGSVQILLVTHGNNLYVFTRALLHGRSN